MYEIDQFKAFASLLAKGLNLSDIAEHFGVTERLVERRLAIAGLIDPILNAYSRDEIRPETLRALTMATKRQQKAWYTLFKSEDEYAPSSAHRSEEQTSELQSLMRISNAAFCLTKKTNTIPLY